MAGYTTSLCFVLNILVLCKGTSGQSLSLTPATVNVTEGESATLTCTYNNDGSCAKSVQWSLDNVIKLILHWDGTTCIKSAGDGLSYTCTSNQGNTCIYTLNTGHISREQHGKTWQCVALPSMYSTKATVYVKVPIASVDVISPSTSSVIVSDNTPSTFVCETSPGRPQATILWYKQLGTNYAVPVAGGVVTTIQNGSLIITRSTLQFTPTRNDHYYSVFCTSYNIDVSFTHTSRNRPQLFEQLPITRVEVISPSTSSVTVSENLPITFVCETSPGRPQATIQWYKQLGTYYAVPVTGGVVTTIHNGSMLSTRSTLQYSPTRNDHDYKVFCASYNIDASSTYTSSNRPQLFVQYAPDTGPVFEGQPSGSTFYTVDGKLQSLTCLAEGGRPLANLVWNCFSGTIQDESTDTTTKQRVTWTATRAHNGRWCICQASHLLWTQHHANVTVQVLYPPTSPTFTMQGQTVSATVYGIEGNTMSVACNSASNPPPAYAWLPKGDSSNNTVLQLTSVTIRDNGVYTCTVSNTMLPSQGNRESGSNSATLSIKVLPKHPEGLDDQCPNLNATVAAGAGASAKQPDGVNDQSTSLNVVVAAIAGGAACLVGGIVLAAVIVYKLKKCGQYAVVSSDDAISDADKKPQQPGVSSDDAISDADKKPQQSGVSSDDPPSPQRSPYRDRRCRCNEVK